MLEILSPERRHRILADEILSGFLNNRVSRQELSAHISADQQALLKAGFTPDDLRLLQSLASNEDKWREAARDRFLRFLKHLGFFIATPEEKVRWIDHISAEKFLDVLSVSNSILRFLPKFRRWSGKSAGASVESLSRVVLHPPDNPEHEFKRFFESMKKNITPQSLQVWAALLYVAIVFAHMFADGNGRLARNAYIALRAGPDTMKRLSPSRSARINYFCRDINGRVKREMLEKEGLQFDNVYPFLQVLAKQGWGFLLAHSDHVLELEAIAVKRVLVRRGLFGRQYDSAAPAGVQGISEDVQKEYANVRKEFFWEALGTAYDRARLYAEWLDSILLH